MRLHIIAAALAAATALSLATPVIAGTVPIDYSLSLTDNGITLPIGTMVLDYDGSTYTLDSLFLTLKKSAYVTSDVTLAPVAGTSDYCLYTFSTCSVVAEKNSLYFLFDPSLTLQTTTLYGYSTASLDTESFALTIQAVPEPATWALMLVGFAAIGASMRWRRRRTVPAAA